MPRFNGTGPCGMGPMTGRGMGSCGRRKFNSEENELESLQEEKEIIKKRLSIIEKEIESLEK